LDYRILSQKRDQCLEIIKKAKASKMKIKYWFPRIVYENKEIYAEIIESGADTLICDHPEDLIAYLKD
jgi:hypothetical protein